LKISLSCAECQDVALNSCHRAQDKGGEQDFRLARFLGRSSAVTCVCTS
jgi:hypothetical protein